MDDDDLRNTTHAALGQIGQDLLDFLGKDSAYLMLANEDDFLDLAERMYSQERLVHTMMELGTIPPIVYHLADGRQLAVDYYTREEWPTISKEKLMELDLRREKDLEEFDT